MDPQEQKLVQSNNNSSNANTNDSNTQRTKRTKEPQAFEELRTLFISGLPADIKEREVHNLMRFFPGYEGCVLNLNETAGRPVCFASFTDHNSALRALRVVQDLRFDPNVAQPLRVEFAKTNSKTRRLPPEFYAEKRRKAPLAAAASPYFGGYNSFGGPEPGWVNPNVLVPWFQNMNLNRGPGGAPSPAPYDLNTYPQPFSVQPPPQSKVPPCSTLFVANLHPDVQERDLNRLFRNLPGFKRLRLSVKDGVSICFVEFDNIQASTHAMNNLQGVPVGPTCMRIEFARTRMGETKRPRDSQEGEDEGQGNMEQIDGVDNLIGGN
jgi:RNA recognition motif-containing protein